MRNICCLNQISHYGTDRLTGDYKLVDDIKDAEGILVTFVYKLMIEPFVFWSK